MCVLLPENRLKNANTRAFFYSRPSQVTPWFNSHDAQQLASGARLPPEKLMSPRPVLGVVVICSTRLPLRRRPSDAGAERARCVMLLHRTCPCSSQLRFFTVALCVLRFLFRFTPAVVAVTGNGCIWDDEFIFIFLCVLFFTPLLPPLGSWRWRWWCCWRVKRPPGVNMQWRAG